MKKSNKKKIRHNKPTPNAEIESLTEDLLAVKEQNAQLQNLLQEKEKSEAALNDDIDSLVEDLLVLKEENAKMESLLQEKETTNQQLQELNQQLQETTQTQTTQLEELQRLLQREQTEKEEKEATITALNNEINAIIDDLASIKEQNGLLSTLLEEKETLNKELQAVNGQLQELNQQLQETTQTQTTQLEELQRLLQTEQKEKEEKEATITALNNEINAIVDDLASIKESKCWIYTKPIRDLQKTIRGTND